MPADPAPAPLAAPGALRVLQVLPSLEQGGVERGTVEMTAAVVAAGGRAVVASAGGRMVRLVERAGGRHVTLGLMTKDPLSIWLNARPLARLVREEGIGIVHARSRAPAWSAWLAARRTGAHFLTTWHGLYPESWPGKHQYNAVMARGERVIAISRFVAEEVARRHGVPAERLRVIPRGVDVQAFDPAAVSGERVDRLHRAWRLPDGVPVVMLPARLTRWKGAEVLVEALALLRRTDAVAVLPGGGGRRGFVTGLLRHAVRLGVSDRLRLPGPCEDMPAALALADAVVSASLRPEPFGRVVIEAQAMGRPVVATDHGGAAETVRDGHTGWRVPPGDPVALARTLDLVLSLREGERAALSAQARAGVLAEFTAARMQAATLAVYRELLLRPDAGPPRAGGADGPPPP